jgi:tRNA(Ile)-lysidine synthetase-like protein
MPSAAMLGEFIRQLQEGEGARLATGDWVLERYRDAVFCYPPALADPPPAVVVAPGVRLEWAAPGQVRVECAPGCAPAGDLVLRARCGGERLATAGGQHRDLKAVFQACAVPSWWRSRLPLLLRRGDAGEELLAVANFARSPAAESDGITLSWSAPTFSSK